MSLYQTKSPEKIQNRISQHKVYNFLEHMVRTLRLSNLKEKKGKIGGLMVLQ
jgi:hypothetical protein